MTLYKNVNGVDMALNSEEEAQYLADQQEFENSRPDRLKKQFTEALAAFIDKTANQKLYKDAVSCSSYKLSTNAQWAAEAEAFIAWRDNCYEYSYDYLAQAESGNIPEPNLEEFISGLPVLEWPTINPE